MKSKKFILTLAAVILSFCCMFTSCVMWYDGPFEQPSVKYFTKEFTITYDYGFHQDGKVMPLLDTNAICFDSEEWFADPLIAGDVITITYTGEMLVQETYPGKIVINNGEIVYVEKNPACLLGAKYTEQGLLLSDKETQMGEVPQYVIYEDGTFAELSSLPYDTQLWATVHIIFDENVGKKTRLDVLALYTYDPQYPVAGATLYPWINQIEDTFLEVEIIHGGKERQDEDAIEIIRVSDDLDEILSYFENMRFKEVYVTSIAPNGGRERLILKTENGEYTITSANGYYEVGGKYYWSNISIPYFENADTMYQFNTCSEKAILDVDGDSVKQYNGLVSALKFKQSEGTVTEAMDKIVASGRKKLVLHSTSYSLYIADERHFWFEEGGMSNVLYELVGERDFSEIFEEFGE